MKTETQTEPRIHTSKYALGTVELKFEGEQYHGNPVLDTRVSINEKDLCWITWEDREAFATELQMVIQKYYI